MHLRLRTQFNADFTEEKYAALVRAVNETEIWPADFRISETPIFLTSEFTQEIETAARDLISQVQTPEFRAHAQDAIPPKLVVPKKIGIRFSCRSISASAREKTADSSRA